MWTSAHRTQADDDRLQDGGVIYGGYTSTITAEESTFTSNRVEGEIYTNLGVPMALSCVSVIGHCVDMDVVFVCVCCLQYGGAIFFDESSNLECRVCNFTTNSALLVSYEQPPSYLNFPLM